MQHNLIREIMLYDFELSHNSTEATENIFCTKGAGGAFDHGTVIRCFNKFCSGCKNLDDQARSDRPKMVDSEALP